MSSYTRRGRFTGMALFLVALGGCASGAGMSGSTAVVSGGAAGAVMPALEDDAIASVLMTANTSEIEEAQHANTAASAQAIRDLATRIESDHRASNERALATLGALGSDSDRHPLRMAMVQNHAEAMQALSPLRGAAFDRAFLERQVALHQYLLTTIDVTLMPSARTAPIRAQLTADRAAVAAHLQMSEALLRSGAAGQGQGQGAPPSRGAGQQGAPQQ